MNKIFYKYRADNDYTEKIFSDHKIWLCPPSMLNDVFECEIEKIKNDFIQKQVEFQMQNHLTSFIVGCLGAQKRGALHYFGLPIEISLAIVDNLSKEQSLEKAYGILKNFMRRLPMPADLSDVSKTMENLTDQLKKIGIFSLSESSENELMWAHYGDYAKGLALGFRADVNSKLLDKNHFFKVNYSDVMPSFSSKNFIAEMKINFGGRNEMNVSFKDPSFQKLFIHKSLNWKYENEWRYVEDYNGEADYPGSLSEIIFGLNCPKEIRDKYIKLAKDYLEEKPSFFEIKSVPGYKRIKRVPLVV